jgi:putative flippase GtrA
MKNPVVQNEMDEFSSVLANLEDSSPLLPASQNLSLQASGAALVSPTPFSSYQPYRWSILNQVLDIVDERTRGRAGWLQRLVSYLFFGGIAALVNLAIFYLMFYHVLAPLHPVPLRNILSYIAAAECSIMANFIPNDRFTFNTLPGAHRPWPQRCLRFHMTTAIGSLLTFLLEMGFSSFMHMEPLLSEATATLLVLIYNFSFHHVFTYRHMKHA